MPISSPLHTQWPHTRSLKSALVELFTTCKSTNVIKLGFPPTLLLADSQSLNSYWHATEKTCLKFVLKNRYWIKVKETTWTNALKHKCRGSLFSKKQILRFGKSIWWDKKDHLGNSRRGSKMSRWRVSRYWEATTEGQQNRKREETLRQTLGYSMQPVLLITPDFLLC